MGPMRDTPHAGRGELPAIAVAVVGDCTLDVTVAPSRPARVGGDVPAAIRLGPGGQAANTAVRLARRGIRARLVSPVADDGAGRLLSEALASEGVELVRLPASRSGTVVALLDPAGERTMLSDRQTLETTAAGRALEGIEWVHCSGYALLDDVSGDALAEQLGRLASSTRVSVAGGSVPRVPAVAERFRHRLQRAGAELVILSRDEAIALGSDPRRPDPGPAAEALRDLAKVVVVTAGILGSAATLNGRLLVEPPSAAPGPTLDATGAGDGYAAALLARLIGGGWPPAADELQAAMRAGSQLGALVARAVGAQARVAGEEPAP